MGSRLRIATIRGALALGLVVALAVGLPHLPRALSDWRLAFDAERGRGALIFVESPEVYTRQRLVNDRYRQDAWLRAKLREIDAPDSLFIDTRSARSLSVAAGTGTGSGTAAAAPDLPAPAQIPFSTRFELQAAARDKIRQLILENALDDRHDLSGNTVFGLKFDTAVLPGGNTRLNPTVVVRMKADPLDALANPPAALAHRFRRDFDPNLALRALPGEAEDARILAQITGAFDAWREDVEARLNARMTAATPACNALSGDPPVTERVLCADGALAPAARAGLDARLRNLAAADAALAHVLRLGDGASDVSGGFRGTLTAEAARQCAATGAADATLEGFLAERQRFAQRFDLVGPWGQLFDLSTGFRMAAGPGCPARITPLELTERDVPVIVAEMPLPEAVLRELGPAGWQRMACGAACGDGARSVWLRVADRDSLNAAESVLTPEALAAMIAGGAREGAPDGTRQQCFARFAPGEEAFFMGSALPAEVEAETACFAGQSFQFRLGAFRFLTRMTEVESYTYAAFPRGDVSGVVRETNDSAALDLSLPGAATGGFLGLDVAQRTAQTEAQPSVINFASGAAASEGAHAFDFGWSIVKPGRKRPMLASQLVLVSVPVYVDRIELEVWTGLLDPDRVPLDRAAYNALPLEDRIARIMPSFERREMTLNVPPADFRLLDGLVIGAGRISGPQLDPEFSRTCHVVGETGPVALVIPGERLWRSTVVTLDGLKADQIEVMPDMEGILATFAVPDGARPSALRPGRHRLSVWTSEGNAPARIELATRAEDCGSAGR